MKILVWNECYVAGGADWSLIDLITHWPVSDDSFVLYVNRTHEGLSLLREKMPSNVEIRVFNSLLELVDQDTKYSFFNNRFIRKMALLSLIPINYVVYKNKISSEHYDILLMNNGGYPGGLSNFLVSLAAKALHIKKRIMIVRNYPAYYSQDRLLMKISDWVSNYSLDGMVAVSNSLKEDLTKKTNIAAEIIEVIYNGISVDNKISHNTGKQEIGFVEGLSVGIIGTLQERKGHYFLFRSWVQVLNKFPDARIYVVASSKSGDKDKLVKLAKQLNIDRSIVWVEFTKNVGDIYQQLDVVVMPSLEYESFGRIIVEAMAFSTPIIATKVGGMPELIEHGCDGLLVDKNDESSLARYIIELLSDAKNRQEIGGAGYKKYIGSYTADVMAGNYYKLLT